MQHYAAQLISLDCVLLAGVQVGLGASVSPVGLAVHGMTQEAPVMSLSVGAIFPAAPLSLKEEGGSLPGLSSWEAPGAQPIKAIKAELEAG